MSQKFSTQLLNQSLLAGTFGLLAIGNTLIIEHNCANAAEVSTTPESVSNHPDDTNRDLLSGDAATTKELKFGINTQTNHSDLQSTQPNYTPLTSTRSIDSPPQVRQISTPDLLGMSQNTSIMINPDLPAYSTQVSLADLDLSNQSSSLSTNALAQTPIIAPPEKKEKKIGVGLGIGTQGIGVDVTTKITPRLHGRIGYSGFSLSTSGTSNGSDYTGTATLGNFRTMADYYLFGTSGLRVTGGLAFQNNRVKATLAPSTNQTVVINDTTYNSTQIGTVNTEGKFANSVAPYLGIGFGNYVSEGLGFNLDLGLMFVGSPSVSASASNRDSLPPDLQAQLDSDINAQISKTNQDIKGFSIFPVLTFGISYGF